MRKACPIVVIALLIGCGGTTGIPDVAGDACPNDAAPVRLEVSTGFEAGQESDSSEPASEAGPIDGAAEAEAEDALAEAETKDAAADTLTPDAASSNDASRGPHDAAAPSHCDDNIQDFDETDVDCGGSCPGCWLAQHCRRNLDCSPIAPGCNTKLGGCACDVVSMTCVASSCVDHRKDGDESDVDCGGVVCPACGTGMICTSNRDCKASSCDAITATCAAAACADHHRDGNESDVDCGGGFCLPCPLGMGCAINYDCVTGACDALTRKCVADTCFDHRWDGNESDVDCGGSGCAARCPVGKLCVTTADCVNGRFCNSSRQCQ